MATQRESQGDEPPLKKQKLVSDTDEDDANMGFGFDMPAFSDHRIDVVADEGASKRSVHVSKLLVAAKSLVLRAKIQKGDAFSEVTLEPGQKIDHFVALLRWFYTGTFELETSDLIEVMFLAYQFKSRKALEACTLELTNGMSVANACQFLERGNALQKLYPDDSDYLGFANLWTLSRTFLRETFKELNLARIASPEFLAMTEEGLKTVLESDELHIGCENVVFAAMRAWIHHKWEERKSSAANLLQCLRMAHVQKNYLLDVIKTEAELQYPAEGKKAFAKKIVQAYIINSTSVERSKVLPNYVEIPPPRHFDERLLQETFEWSIPDIEHQHETWSSSFFLGGYYLYLLMQRKKNEKKGGSLGLYMNVKVKESGLGEDFFIPLAFELFVKNKTTGAYVSSKGAYASPFSWANRAWGYTDILGIPWDDFVKPDCVYNHNGTIHVKAVVWFKDYWEKLTNNKNNGK